jgi:hypothetical protein
MLNQHPRILTPAKKESFFFHHLWEKPIDGNWDWYRSIYPELGPDESHDDGKITGDYSIDYMFDPHAALRVRLAAPQAKMVVLIRDPVDRMYSEYQMRWAGSMTTYMASWII